MSITLHIPDILKEPEAVLNFINDKLSLADGLPGILSLFAALQNCDEIVHRYVLKIKQILEGEGLPYSLSLTGGLAGLCYAIHLASQEGKRYQRMHQTLHQLLIKGLDRVYISPLWANIRTRTPSSAALYDAIQGLSGAGRYILEAGDSETIQNILKVLIAFTHPLEHGVPGWLNIEGETPHYNLGLSHGIPGVLSLLSIAALKGIEIEGQREAIATVADWIRQFPIIEENTMRWPYHVSLEEEREKRALPQSYRDAWCYGAPGVSRALFLAGKALGNAQLKAFAMRSFSDIFKRTRAQWNLPGPTICHGIAGLLLTANAMAGEQEGEALLPHAASLLNRLMAHYHPEYPFGFKDVEGSVELDKPGLIEGAAGCFLALQNPPPKYLLPFFIHE